MYFVVRPWTPLRSGLGGCCANGSSDPPKLPSDPNKYPGASLPLKAISPSLRLHTELTFAACAQDKMASTAEDTTAETPAAAPASDLTETEAKALPPAQAKLDEAPETSAPAGTSAASTAGVEEGGEKPTAAAIDASEKPAVAAAAATATSAAAPAVPEAAAAAAAGQPPSAFASFAEQLPAILREVGHDEMWGVSLAGASTTEPSVPVSIVLQKFLNANEGDLAKGVEQLKAALRFRKEKQPLKLLEKTFSQAKFGDLGAVTVYPAEGSEVPEVFTWNLYGNVKDRMDEVFVPLDE
jgi:hypothetical protein